MIKRMTWFIGGAVAGVAGASVAKKKVKQAATHLTRPRTSCTASPAAFAMPSPRVAAAMRAKEAELRARLDGTGDHARRRSR